MTAMPHLEPSATGPVLGAGDVQFVTPGVKVELCNLHASAGLLMVEVLPPPWGAPSSAGRVGLRQAIDHAIEMALDARGAAAPGVADVSDLDQSLSDQLYRARMVGAAGLLVYLPNLSSATNLATALDAEDSAVLRWWIAAVGERPVVLLLDESNRSVGAYGPPVRLDRLVKLCADDAPRPTAPRETLAAAPEEKPQVRAETPPSDGRPRAVFRGPAKERNAPRLLKPVVDLPEERAPAPPEPAPAREVAQGAPAASARALQEPPAERQLLPLFPRANEPAATKAEGAREPGPDWRMCANDLNIARGPKPLTMVERLFMSRYVPLLEAIGAGAADESARGVAEQWAESFSRSYTEGFSAVRVTGKRPRMVLDAPQLASQIARLHGAKSAQLVLVDALRFDLGLRVQERMRAALASHATCSERLLLWAALPTTTLVQLDLLAHGPEGLASRGPPTEREESGQPRGRAVPTFRRMRVGSRDLMKLDWVESRLRDAGPPLQERLDAVADEITPALVAFARSLAPRTLMFVFGDHGFRMESRDAGTMPARWGGASPEEVLVPAFAWLVGDVH